MLELQERAIPVNRLRRARCSSVCGTAEEQKTFPRSLIEPIEVRPREGEALVYWKKLPAPPTTGANGAGMSFTVVAGARFEPATPGS